MIVKKQKSYMILTSEYEHLLAEHVTKSDVLANPQRTQDTQGQLSLEPRTRTVAVGTSCWCLPDHGDMLRELLFVVWLCLVGCLSWFVLGWLVGWGISRGRYIWPFPEDILPRWSTGLHISTPGWGVGSIAMAAPSQMGNPAIVGVHYSELIKFSTKVLPIASAQWTSSHKFIATSDSIW